MQYDEHVASSARELSALIDCLLPAPLDLVVPSCPEWTLRDLAVHVGEFCGFWTHVLCEGAGRVRTPFPDVPTDDARVVDWLANIGSHLSHVLASTPAETRVWTWFESDHSAGFVARRCAHELSIHRYDAQTARDACTPIPAELASDGIDEMLDALVTVRDRTHEAKGETLHLHGTDVHAEWTVTMFADRIEVSRKHAKADFAMRGGVSDIELTLYGRPPIKPVERFGDDAVFGLWRREFSF